MSLPNLDDARRELAHFLASRRARLAPSDVGLADGRRRRVPGLRREEVAVLAGVSETWYARLEQGVPINASPQVLDAVARALRLDDHERDYLFTLAGVAHERSSRVPAAVPIALRQLLDALEFAPAVVYGPRWDILAWNRAYVAVFGDPATQSELKRNVLHQIFLDPSRRALFPDWELLARRIVEQFRVSAGRYSGDPSFAALIAHVSERSAEFRALWATHDVWQQTEGEKRVDHPRAGALRFDHASLAMPDAPDVLLVTYTAGAGSPTAEAVRMLVGQQ